MIQYIDKDALVAEIGRRKEINKYRDTPDGLFEDEAILSFINTLEVKEVDLEKKIDIEWNKCNPVDEGMGCEFATIGIEQFYFITKYFFELGLKAQKGE